MRKILPESFLKLADVCQHSLYIVGGSVRDWLMGLPVGEHADWDICSAASEDELIAAARACGFQVRAVYRRTGTVKLEDAHGIGCEFTRFRYDTYEHGVHAPVAVSFTDDIEKDARRRDFCANAVYYDIKGGVYCDPLGGIPDIENKILRTVAPATQVFGEDGLRLMRLARIAAQTGFSPDEECLAGAREHAALIQDIVPERIFTELRLLLSADGKRGDSTAVYRGLCLLRDTGVLRYILPELAAGEGVEQRKDFHNYDVLEHSFRCAMYAPAQIRFAALLHDVGKPFCLKRDGNFFAHPEEGARIAAEILCRLKAPKHEISTTCTLIQAHMRDFDLKMRDGKVRREIFRYYPVLEELFALKQADFSACKDDLSPAPSVVKWNKILAKMKKEGVPFTPSALAVNGRELQAIGVPTERTAEAIRYLLDYCLTDGSRNRKETLLTYAEKHCI